MKSSKNKRQTGKIYEELAADYLEQKGYIILEKNYRNKFGEIDIIAENAMDKSNNMIIYIEIKYRTDNSCGDPLEAVDFRKQRRISQTAFYHYTKSGYESKKSCRFDVIAVYGDKTIKHIEDAFDFCGYF